MTEYTMEDFRAEMKRRGIAPPRGWEGSLCDCGEEKRPNAECCDRCRYLDGGTTLQHHVIMALRGTDGLSLSELSEEVYGYANRSTNRSVWRIMQSLLAAGRVRRYWAEIEDPITRRCFSTGTSRLVFEAWRYALHGDGRARRQAA